jgi:tetratricopeptide (TPR) repeat protein
MDATTTIRRLGWDRNKRTLAAPARVDESTLQKARKWHADGQYEDALHFLEGVPSCADDPRCLRIVGLCQLGLGHSQEATELFMLARELNRTELARDELNLCMALIGENRLLDAKAAAMRAVELAPNEPWTHVNLIVALKRLNNQEELELSIRDLRENYPDVIDSAIFRERLDKDPDFIGVADLLESLNTERKKEE